MYQPERTEVDVTVKQSPSAIIADTRARLLALVERTDGSALPNATGANAKGNNMIEAGVIEP
jgi:hypothetical protein